MESREKDLEELTDLYLFKDEAMDNLVTQVAKVDYTTFNNYVLQNAVREASDTHIRAVVDYFQLYKQVHLNYDWLKK